MQIPDLPEMHMELPKQYGKEQDKKATAEVDMCRERLIQWCQGEGLDLGCGASKIKPDVIGIDDCDKRVANILGDITDLSRFATGVFDFIFSSHALEDIQDTKSTLTEWLRVIKPGGYLVLYCPDKQYYYNLDDPRHNQRHKHDFYWWDVAKIINEINEDTELIHYNRIGPVYETGEWSWELVVRKL